MSELGTIKVYDTVEAAQDAASKEAAEAGVSPSAVMHSAPEGYSTGVDKVEFPEEEHGHHLMKVDGDSVAEADADDDDDPESMTKDEIKAELDAKGVEY